MSWIYFLWRSNKPLSCCSVLTIWKVQHDWRQEWHTVCSAYSLFHLQMQPLFTSVVLAEFPEGAVCTLPLANLSFVCRFDGYWMHAFSFEFPVKMWRAAFLLLAASLSFSLARPHMKPLSSEMVNYINKLNTTWTVSSSCVLPFEFFWIGFYSQLRILICAPGWPQLP